MAALNEQFAKLGGPVKADTASGVVAVATSIYDETSAKYQSEINDIIVGGSGDNVVLDNGTKAILMKDTDVQSAIEAAWGKE